MKLIKNIFLIIFLAFTLPAIAQKDSSAKKILDATSHAFVKGGGTSVKFTVSTFNGNEENSKTSGTIYIKGKKFQMSTPELITWFNGKTEWSYVKANDEVNVSNPTNTELQAMNPYAVLDLYKNGYNYQMKEVVLRSKSCYEVTLTAENGKAGLQEIILDIDKSNYQPYCIRIRQGKKGWTRITIHTFTNNQKYSDTLFQFNAKDYPKAEIIDLR